MSIVTDQDLERMHPRQAAVLREVPPEFRDVVASRARLLMNTGGGNYSGNLWIARQEFNRLGGDAKAAEELEHRSRHDNISAMRSCGCGACQQSVARMSGQA